MEPTVEDKSDFVTTHKGIGGWKAVHYWWNNTGEGGLPGFWEPYQTGVGYYRTEKEAVVEAKMWARSDEMRYVERQGN